MPQQKLYPDYIPSEWFKTLFSDNLGYMVNYYVPCPEKLNKIAKEAYNILVGPKQIKEVKVFDHMLWAGKDKGNNEHCYRECTILSIYQGLGTYEHDLLIDVKFSDRRSNGHFLSFKELILCN